MTTLIGIDPSLRRTGLARIVLADATAAPTDAGRCAVDTWSRPSVGTRRDDIVRRADRLTHITADVLAYALPCDLVVIEGPSIGSGGIGSAWDRAGLWWRIIARLVAHDIPIAIAPPATRAKWITGRGDADKAAVHQAITQLWHPHGQPGNHDEADALVVASMGAQWLGLLPHAGPDPAALAGAAWPDRERIAA